MGRSSRCARRAKSSSRPASSDRRRSSCSSGIGSCRGGHEPPRSSARVCALEEPEAARPVDHVRRTACSVRGSDDPRSAVLRRPRPRRSRRLHHPDRRALATAQPGIARPRIGRSVSAADDQAELFRRCIGSRSHCSQACVSHSGSPRQTRTQGSAATRSIPAADVQTDEQLRAWIRRAADTIYHPVGTCRMGHDAASVVDPELRVRGVEGLRIADASIMPSVVNSQTNAACMMIAERAAELIGGKRPA